MKEQVLYIHVGEPESKMRDRALAIAKALDAGKEVEPYVGIGFALTDTKPECPRWSFAGQVEFHIPFDPLSKPQIPEFNE